MKFRRKSATSEPVEETAEEAGSEASAPHGPYDVDDVADDGTERIDLGSLLITPEPNRELRLQVDEASQAVQAVLLAGPDGALELRAFSASRNGDLWSEVRPHLASDMARRGGTATEREGRFGPELACQLTVQSSEGRTTQQPSRIVGVNGARWMLRATFLGRPATDPEAAVDWEETLARVVVRRGEQAMPPGDPLPLRLPDNARKQQPPTA